MKANELRIGNEIQFVETKYPLTARGIFPDYGILVEWNSEKYGNQVEEFKISELEPIPLTEEWLVKFGFESSDLSDGSQLYSIGEGDNYFEVWFNKDIYYYDSVTLLNVHKLQNLYFALTGEELTIKE